MSLAVAKSEPIPIVADADGVLRVRGTRVPLATVVDPIGVRDRFVKRRCQVGELNAASGGGRDNDIVRGVLRRQGKLYRLAATILAPEQAS